MPGRSLSGASFYEYKLEQVMRRLAVDSYNYNWDRWGCYVDFIYRGERYCFEHSVKKAKERGIELRSGSEAFIQLVLTFEDLARILERGVYGLEKWVQGMRHQSSSAEGEVPGYFKVLGFEEIPSGPEEVQRRYQVMMERLPAEGTGNDDLQRLKEAADQALRYFQETQPNLH